MSIEATLPEPINWESVLEESPPPELTGPPRLKGIQFHDWLQDQYRDSSFDFERELEWLNEEDEWVQGRYDCSDGFYIYEFKTTEGIPSKPYTGHVDQLSDYLEAVDTEFGFLVYVDRESWDVEQYEVRTGSG